MAHTSDDVGIHVYGLHSRQIFVVKHMLKVAIEIPIAIYEHILYKYA